MRIFTLIWTYLRISVANELQYRSNLYIQLVSSAIALLIGLVGLQLVFSQTESLAGWSAPELLTVMGVYMLMGGVIRAYIQPNMLRLMEEIQEGNLDFALSKPFDGQVVVSLREFHLWSMVDVVLGLIVIGVAVNRSPQQIGLWQELAFAVALVLGAVILYCFWLILSASAF
jgi:ABC-2 type transport system permease protein